MGVKTLPTGEFGAVTEPFYFTGGSNEGMDVSPDGRFVAIIGIDQPQLTIVGLDPSGSFRLVQSLTFGYQNSQRIRYTPDGRHLLMLFSEGDFLVSMSVNSVTGEVTEVDHATLDPDALGGYPIDALAITPDSKYVATLTGNLVTNEQTFLVFRLEEDGHLTRITQTRNDWPGYVSDMDFIPPYREPVTAASTGWMFYQWRGGYSLFVVCHLFLRRRLWGDASASIVPYGFQLFAGRAAGDERTVYPWLGRLAQG